MSTTLLGRKVGMTRIYTEGGIQVPVTIVACEPNFVSQIKTAETDGYEAVQLAFDEIKPRRSTFQEIGHDAKAGLAPHRFHREVRLEDGKASEYELGQSLTVEIFEGVSYVDVIGTSKGKGFQGAMKRHNFKGQLASHGVERKHRSPGSICGHASFRGRRGGPKKGKKMPGHMGDAQVTVRNLDVVGIDKENNLLLVKGPVPGPRDGLLIVRSSKRLWKNKANAAKAS